MPQDSPTSHFNLEEIHAKAHEELHEEGFKKAVEEHKKKLHAKRAHIFPKRICFQWPMRLEDWYNPKK